MFFLCNSVIILTSFYTCQLINQIITKNPHTCQHVSVYQNSICSIRLTITSFSSTPCMTRLQTLQMTSEYFPVYESTVLYEFMQAVIKAEVLHINQVTYLWDIWFGLDYQVQEKKMRKSRRKGTIKKSIGFHAQYSWPINILTLSNCTCIPYGVMLVPDCDTILLLQILTPYKSPIQV